MGETFKVDLRLTGDDRSWEPGTLTIEADTAHLEVGGITVGTWSLGSISFDRVNGDVFRMEVAEDVLELRPTFPSRFAVVVGLDANSPATGKRVEGASLAVRSGGSVPELITVSRATGSPQRSANRKKLFWLGAAVVALIGLGQWSETAATSIIFMALIVGGVVYLAGGNRRKYERARQAFDRSAQTYAEWFAGVCARHGFAWSGDITRISWGWTSVGGHGWAPSAGKAVALGFADEGLIVAGPTEATLLHWSDIHSLEFGGPGLTVSGGGFIGGGFGVGGALAGMAVATVLNSLTTKAAVNSLAFLQAKGGGVVLHTSQYTPDSLRIVFSAVLGALAERATKTSASRPPMIPDSVGQLERLVRLRDAGELTAEEFQAMKASILPMRPDRDDKATS